VTEPWPTLPFSEWQDTCDTLHMWTQVVGKTRMALTPLLNHWWNVTLYVTPRGLTTSPIPFGSDTFEAEFDFIGHKLHLYDCKDGKRDIALYPRSVADFHAEYMSCLRSLGIEVKINTLPSEFPDPIPFEEDHKHAAYDKQYVERFHRILIGCDRLLQAFRSRFIGKSSPVHFFWGSFDLAVTRFSGKPAPPRPGADSITREAYSHEAISCGFWPGDARFPHPAFYAYAAPPPAGLEKQPRRPKEAYWDTALGEFLLKYDDVRSVTSPDDAVLEFCQCTYEAAANLAGWDRAALERS
jgi:hypothetical protein